MMNTDTSKQPTLKVLMLDTQGVHADWQSEINSTGRYWDVLRVDNSSSLIAFMKESNYHAIAIASSNRIHADQDCFKKAMTMQPRAVRILLPGMPLSSTQTNRSQDLVHRIYSEQNSIPEIAADTEYLVRISRLIHKKPTRDYILSLGQLPSPPAVYRELNRALNSENSNAEQISDIIGQDPALAAKVLRVVNSAYFGIDRQISSIRESVTMLGIRTLRGLALSGHLMSLYPQHRNWSYFSFEELNRRAAMVARLAQYICREMKTSQAVQDQAFVGGLLHDLGLLVLASKDPQSYRKVMVLSAQKELPLCSVEKKMLGLFHGEVGAFLLAHWNLPAPIVEAVLLHHTPQLSVSSEFSPLAAVHIADSLLPQPETEIGANLSNRLMHDYLKRIGVADRVAQWQITANLLHDTGSLTRH